MHYMGVRQWMQTEYVTTNRKYTLIIIRSLVPGEYESKQNSALLGSINTVCSLPSLIYIFFTYMNFRELIMYWMIQLDYTHSLDVVLRPLYGLIFRGLFKVKKSMLSYVCRLPHAFYALYLPSVFGSGCCRKILHYIWAENVFVI